MMNTPISNDPGSDLHQSPPISEQLRQVEADLALLQQTNARLEQQIKDNAIELQATVDEFLIAKEETEKAKAEAENAKREAEQANAVKSAFLASISHELRTPLNAILNFSQFVASGLLGPINKEQVEMLDKITSSGTHLLDLINDVLDISKIEAGSLRLFVEANIDLVEVARAVADTGRALLAGKPVELRLEAGADIPRITADKRRIRQILLNLVSNACKFTETGEIIISLCSKEGEVQISVQDSGPGISPEDVGVIFEAFRQTKVGLKQGSGTGLGLTISKRLAQAHGGRVWVESQPGSGATFFVALPLQPPAPAR